MTVPSLSDRRRFLALSAATLAGPWLPNRPLMADDTVSTGRDPLMTSTNPVIVKAREAALEVLKPTRAQLEHGLELHRQSLVFDAYGFAPRAALDGAALTADRGRARRIGSCRTRRKKWG